MGRRRFLLPSLAGAVAAPLAAEALQMEAGFAAMARDRVAGVVVLADPLFLSEHRRITSLAHQARLATVFHRSENVEAGGLIHMGHD